jgi:transcriptional regulator with PAS, ATPase and Fis domain
MSEASTGAMQQFAESDGANKPSVPGLVLLYAEEFSALPAAWPLLAKNNVVGRETEHEIFLPVHAVSRTHCSIAWERDGFTLRDLGSTNGTLVDGRRAVEARLEHGCELRIGDAILKFVARDADRLRHYRIDGALQDGAKRQASQLTTLLGGCQMDGVAAELERIARTPLSVMVLGESGTGKEVVARELHQLSQRKGGFCAVNCAAIPANLLESELFGYKKGAFSGADRDKPGLIKTAHQGTLLLDEIGDMPSEAQAKLLRVLQSREVFPLGATAPEPVDVRVICATHRDLGRLREQGKFRDDLFARLNEYQLRLPPLRERKEDIYQLARAFLEAQQRSDVVLSFPFMTGLLHYDWPHNVRELESCMKRSIAVTQGPLLEAQHLPPAVLDEMQHYGSPLAGPAQVASDGAPSDAALRELLSRHQGNVAAVGRELGKARMQVHRWLKRYEIDLDDYR